MVLFPEVWEGAPEVPTCLVGPKEPWVASELEREKTQSRVHRPGSRVDALRGRTDPGPELMLCGATPTQVQS